MRLDPYVLSSIKTVPSIPFCFQTHHILINLDVRTNSQKKDDEEAGLTKQGMMSSFCSLINQVKYFRSDEMKLACTYELNGENISSVLYWTIMFYIHAMHYSL